MRDSDDDRDTEHDDATDRSAGDADRGPPLDPVAFYDEFGEREWDRLEGDLYHRLEWEGTVAYLDRDLPDPEAGPILDVGGGAGRYAVWLAERGHEVVLADPSHEQIAVARRKATERAVGDAVDVHAGDVRRLPHRSGSFAATLCLGGPLSHVLAAGERERAAAELRRVTASGGPVFVSVMGRLAALQTIVSHAGRLPSERDETELLPALAREGTYDRDLLDRFDREPTSVAMHLFRADELETLLDRAGLDVAALVALESIASVRREWPDDLADDHAAAIRRTVEALREDRSVVDLSGHMLAVCRA